MGVQPSRLPQLGKCNIDFWRHGHSPGLTVLGMPQGKLLPAHVYVGPFQPEKFTKTRAYRTVRKYRRWGAAASLRLSHSSVVAMRSRSFCGFGLGTYAATLSVTSLN